MRIDPYEDLCRTEVPEDSEWEGFVCSLLKDHKGPHMAFFAHDPKMPLVELWDNENDDDST